MAKTKEPAAPTSMKPRLYLDLTDSSIIREVTVGKEVTLVVQGKVCGISERENLYDGKKEKCASLDLEGYKVKLTTPNAWERMAEEDD